MHAPNLSEDNAANDCLTKVLRWNKNPQMSEPVKNHAGHFCVADTLSSVSLNEKALPAVMEL
jgi:hypothetical protein